MHWQWLVPVLSFLQLVRGALITIDDENGDPTNGKKIDYQPPGAWVGGAIGGCDNTCALPDPSQVSISQGTYTGSIFNVKNHPNHSPLNATVTFTGSSVSVNCLLSNSLRDPVGSTDMTFVLDGVPQVPSFHHTAGGSTGYVPTTVFQSGSLPMKEHTLVICNGLQNGPTSLVVLDSIVYSTDPNDQIIPTGTGTLPSGPGPAPSTSVPVPSSNSAEASAHPTVKTANNAAIVGAVVAVVAVLLLLALAFLYIRQRRKNQKQHRSNVPLSTTLLAPFQNLWSSSSGGRARSSQQQDMAPVPFPTPAQPVSRPAPAPAARPRPRRPPLSDETQSRLSRLSFNPNLLVGRFRRQPPPPIVTQPDPRMATASPAIPSGNPLIPPISQQNLQLDRVASIQAWQQRTLEETARPNHQHQQQIPVHPMDMSEVDLSTHYDESSISGPPAAPQPAALPRSPQPQRRFTVMNN